MISEALPALKSELKPLKLLWGGHLPQRICPGGHLQGTEGKDKIVPKEKPPGLAREAESIPSMNLAMKLEVEPRMRNQINAESQSSPPAHV